MPAPAVIPALIAYVKVVAVKTLVVGFRPLDADGGDLECAPQRVRRATDKSGRWSNVPATCLAPAGIYKACSALKSGSCPVAGANYHE